MRLLLTSLPRTCVALAVLCPLGIGQDHNDNDRGTEPTLPSQVTRAHGTAGSGYWSIRLGYYNKDDSGAGNPFVDESVTVIEPVIIYDYQASEDFGYNLELSYDNVSSASIDRLSNFDGQSGASGDYYGGLKAAFRHRLSDKTDLHWHTDVSFEYDYFSVGLGAGVTKDLDPQDAIISANLNAFFDDVQLIRYNGVDEGNDNRTTISGSVSWYQVLSPDTHGEFGLALTAQSGYLESPINAVVIEDPALPPNPLLANNARGIETGEELPDSRFRTALYSTIRHSLNPTNAVEIGARIYTDDWGINSYDLTPKFIHEFESGLLWDLRLRYYSQSAADAYQTNFTDPLNVPAERTQDSELAEFDSTLFGTHLRWGSNVQWDAGVDFLSRSDDLDHMFLSIGYKSLF